MRGRKPKEREKYVIRLGDGTLVEVDREVYLEWYRSKRQERYQKERERKYGVCSLEGLWEKGYFPEVNKHTRDATQEAAFGNIEKDKLRYALSKLSEQDALLVRLLYFEDATVKETAEIIGCSRKAVRSKREKILKKLGRQLIC